MDDFSVRLDQLWDYDRPQVSLERFKTELEGHPAGSREALETMTQIARAQGLQRRFDEADRALDTVAANLKRVPARVRVRYLLERGRVRNSAGEPEKAMTWFTQAADSAVSDKLPGSEFYRVDALHMLAIAAPPADRLDRNLEALAAAEASTDPRVRRWRASLYNNIGWTYHDRGDYAQALHYFELALPAWEERGGASNVRVAKWAIARALRSLGRNDEALAMQEALRAETERIHEPDGYIYEELGELAVARKDANASRWFAKAYELLKDDANFAATEPARLARLRSLAQSGVPQ
ncbi:MAG TPA: tetratricopeptide repeat protein [Casimicrobiaceae bacterium]|nr:tetratricopeptide repeat protein [Casimicrobiaceae bacterium]